MPHEFAQLTATQLLELPRQQTVFFFPVGPLEDHGPHLPLGLDGMEAHHLCVLTATRLETELPGWRGVIMPTCPIGIDTNTTSLALPIRAHVLRDYLVDSCRGLSRHDFRHYVCFSGHLGPRQLTAIEEAGKLVSGRFLQRKRKSQRPYLLSASSGLVSATTARRSPFWPDAAEHAGKRDTSIAQALALYSAAGASLDSTRASAASPVAPASAVSPPTPASASSPSAPAVATASLPKISPAPGFWTRAWSRQRRQLSGYWGSPMDATPTWGTQLLTEQVGDLFPHLKAVWTGSAKPATFFKSWYSIVPTNKSFFRAWLLAIGLLTLMTIWIYLAILSIASA